MRFATIIGVDDKLVELRAIGADELAELFKSTLRQGPETVEGVKNWASQAALGDYLDWHGGWVFAVAGESDVLDRAGITDPKILRS